MAMADQRALDAISRIERALARVETAAQRPAPATTESADYLSLQDSHDRLRERVAGALAQLDGLIDRGARG